MSTRKSIRIRISGTDRLIEAQVDWVPCKDDWVHLPDEPNRQVIKVDHFPLADPPRVVLA